MKPDLRISRIRLSDRLHVCGSPADRFRNRMFGPPIWNIEMFAIDLSPYRHGVPVDLKDVVTIGWLSRDHPYSQGEVPPETAHHIEQLLSSHRLNQMRGPHVCEFCSVSPLISRTPSGQRIMLGSAEIWVPSADGKKVYATPDLIHHYVVVRRYLPLIEFLEAVMTVHEHRGWDPDRESQARLEAAFHS
jgi:hypothetical protein